MIDFIKDHEFPQLYNYETISSDASRRTIFIRFLKDGHRADFVCAEPSPDALQAYANALVAAARANVQGNAEAAAEFGRSLSTSAAPLLYRSQGLQLFRDQMFNLCLMRMNGIIDNQRYITLLQKQIDATERLIRIEKTALEKVASRAPVVVTSNADLKSLIDTANSLASAIKADATNKSPTGTVGQSSRAAAHAR